ncbi:MAG: hypothetical protein IKO06_00500 [Alphaproteobacteria bacterium]|nr:hypothetical protein [Alphaproteobacteria bacterium]
MGMFDNSKQKALKELLEVLGKGVDLLANENLDKDLYEAFEKYASSTIKMVDEAYYTNYSFGSMNAYSSILGSYGSNNWMQNYTNPIDISMRNSYAKLLMGKDNSVEYRNKLKTLLQQLISIAKIVIYE